MRITSQMMFNSLTYNIMNIEEDINRETNQASSNRRITKPSDDPIGTTRAMKYRSNLTEFQKYTDNSNAASSLLNATDTACISAISYLQRVRAIVLQGANSTYNDIDWDALATEVDNIKVGLMDLANTTVGNRYIFAGEKYTDAAYTMRANVTGNTRDLVTHPIVIDARNYQIKIKLDDTATKTISLTRKTYDGTPGHTLDDLINDVQIQLNNAGFAVPVYAKVTADNQLSFFAGKKPDDGTPHTLVVKDGPAIKDIGTAVSATNGAPPSIVLDPATANSTVADYYNGWTIRITAGKGAGQSNRITDYDETTNEAEVAVPWLNTPDATSEYELVPPMDGIGNVTVGAGNDTFALPGLCNDFFNGMTLNLTDSLGHTESRRIIGYDGTDITVAADWGPPLLSGPVTYSITSATEGIPAGGGNLPAPYIDLAANLDLDQVPSEIDDFYRGASITVTYGDGSTETRTITGYDHTTQRATVDGTWSQPINGLTKYSISDITLSQLGFDNQDTTKEIVGNPLADETLILGQYPTRSMVQGSATVNDVTLNMDDDQPTGYYDNWTIEITGGPGAGQIRTLSGYTQGSGFATVTPAWDVQPTVDSSYALRPPLIGQANALATNSPAILQLGANASTVPDFYNGMTITINRGTGASAETRTITDYDPLTRTVTLDRDWGNPIPDANSFYAIDAEPDVAADNKFTITVGNNIPQQISLDGGEYTPKQLAHNVQARINERGGDYANVRVEVTSDNQLKMVYQDPDANDNDAPLMIKLNSGSPADVLPHLGFADGTVSETTEPNYEGNHGNINYNVNLGVKIQVNIPGDSLFDPIFQHLSEISISLRGGNLQDLGNIDLVNITDDINNVLITQGEIGAKVNRLTNGITRLTNLSDNVTQLQSEVEDVDITKVISDLEMKKIAYQAALQIGAQIMPISLLNYLQ